MKWIEQKKNLHEQKNSKRINSRTSKLCHEWSTRTRRYMMVPRGRGCSGTPVINRWNSCSEQEGSALVSQRSAWRRRPDGWWCMGSGECAIMRSRRGRRWCEQNRNGKGFSRCYVGWISAVLLWSWFSGLFLRRAVRCGGACGGGLSVGQSSHRRPAPWFVFEDGRAKIGRRSLKWKCLTNCALPVDCWCDGWMSWMVEFLLHWRCRRMHVRNVVINSRIDGNAYFEYCYF